MDEDGDGLDDGIPNMARAFDHLLGGETNTLVDREFVEAALDVFPGLPRLCRDLRAFSRAVVGHLAAQGMDQFVDLGSGIPTVRPVHEVAPDARVVYVDHEARTVALARAVLGDRQGVAVVRADVRDVPAICDDPDFRATIDLARPVAVLALGILHYVGSDEARRVVHDLHAATVPGSILAVTGMTDLNRPDIAEWAAYSHEGLSYAPELRTPEDMTPWLTGWEVLGPGWVSAPHWVPDEVAVPGPAETRSGHWGVVARRV